MTQTQIPEYVTPTCPSCGEELKTLYYNTYDTYEFMPETGGYKEMPGEAQIKCSHCNFDLTSEKIFEFGPANYEPQKWPTFEPNYDADVPKGIPKSDTEAWPCKHCDTLGGNHERVSLKNGGTMAGRCSPSDLENFRSRQKE